MRLAHGVAVLTANDGRPSDLIVLIVPLDEDLAYSTRAVERLAFNMARTLRRRGPAVLTYRLAEWNPDQPITLEDLEDNQGDL